MPGRLNELIGVPDDARSRACQRAVGVRELAAGAGLLGRRRPVGWLWARVAGDLMDLTLLGLALRSPDARPERVAGALAAVGGVAVADVVAAVRLSRTPAGAPDGRRVTTAITVLSPPAEVYAFWRDVERLPRFMHHLESVRSTGERRSHWTAKAPLGRTVEWDAEIVEDRPGELIAWRAVAGMGNAGTVRFKAAPGDRGTEIELDMTYAPPGGAAGAALARLLGEAPRQQARDDLRRFKQVIEAGEVVRSEGSPEGTVARRQLKQRPARPAEST